MAKTKSTEFDSLVSVKLPATLRARLDTALARERAARTMMAISLSDVVRTLLVEALDVRDAVTSRASRDKGAVSSA